MELKKSNELPVADTTITTNQAQLQPYEKPCLEIHKDYKMLVAGGSGSG